MPFLQSLRSTEPTVALSGPLKKCYNTNTMVLLKWCINSRNCAHIFTIIDQSSTWWPGWCFCWTLASSSDLQQTSDHIFWSPTYSANSWFVLTDCPFLCLRLYRTVQLIWRGFLLERNADSHFAFKNWKTWEGKMFCVSFVSMKDIITVCFKYSLSQCFSTLMLLEFLNTALTIKNFRR